jgi:hypothetical protein
LLVRFWGDTDRFALASSRLRELRQGRRPALAYATEFRELAANLQWNDEDFINQLRAGEREQLVGMFKVKLNHIGSSFILIPKERAILSCYPLVRDLGTCCHICSNYKDH